MQHAGGFLETRATVEEQEPCRSPVRILIVDGEPRFLESAQRVLGEEGFTTATAFDGPGALQVDARLGPFDVLIAAVDMPEMNGAELARQVRRRRPDLRVLYLISARDPAYPERTPFLQYEACLTRSRTVEGLIETVSELLNRT